MSLTPCSIGKRLAKVVIWCKFAVLLTPICVSRHIYRKWNQKLFEEMYLAYKSGRAEKNPADFWYAGEIGFFDFYMYVSSLLVTVPSHTWVS